MPSTTRRSTIEEEEGDQMPAQKRSLAAAVEADSSPTTATKDEEDEEEEEEKEEEEEGGEEKKQQEQPELPKQEDDSKDDEGSSEAEEDEFIFVKLADIRKEVQCPICLGIIRKTRTVMECLHRFCRECIDKSMRLGNNECPACRTHCASRRSLRDDPNYDALIAALYPDIDKYEEEELAFHEEEQNRNKKIQASIAETFRRQSEALGRKRSATRTRRSQYRRGRGRSSGRDTSFAVSEDEEEEEANGNDGKESSSADEPSPNRRPKKRKRWVTPRSSPARIAGNTDTGGEENDDVETRDNRGTSPLRVGNREMLAWGRGGVRSQTRHGNSSGANGRFIKGGRVTKLVEYIRNLEEKDNEFDVHLTLLPMDEQSMPSLQRPYICCRPSLSIGHLCQFIASQINVKDEAVELFARKPHNGSSKLKPSASVAKADCEPEPLNDLQVLKAHEFLAGLCDFFTNAGGNLVLMYHLKKQS